MRFVNKFLVILVCQTFISCHITSHNKAFNFYFENRGFLNNVVKSMNDKKLFTHIHIYKKSFIQKVLSLNFNNEISISISYTNYRDKKFISINKVVNDNNFSGIPEEYLKKVGDLNNIDIKEIYDVLNFMYTNDIRYVIKNCDDCLDVKIDMGFEKALQYSNVSYPTPDISQKFPIEGNWFYVTFK